jgi:hypothetical protein
MFCFSIIMHPYTDRINPPETEPIDPPETEPIVNELLPVPTLFASRTVLAISGIDKDDNGRSCANHNCCVHFIIKRDILFLQQQIQIINGQQCDVIKAFLVDRTTSLGTCHVGYVPDRYFAMNPHSVFNGVYLYVEHDYRFSMLESNRGFRICSTHFAPTSSSNQPFICAHPRTFFSHKSFSILFPGTPLKIKKGGNTIQSAATVIHTVHRH